MVALNIMEDERMADLYTAWTYCRCHVNTADQFKTMIWSWIGFHNLRHLIRSQWGDIAKF